MEKAVSNLEYIKSEFEIYTGYVNSYMLSMFFGSSMDNWPQGLKKEIEDSLVGLLGKAKDLLDEYFPNKEYTINHAGDQYVYPNYFFGAIEEEAKEIKLKLLTHVSYEIESTIARLKYKNAVQNKEQNPRYEWPSSPQRDGKTFIFDDKNKILFTGHRFLLCKTLFDAKGQPVLLQELIENCGAKDPTRTLGHMEGRFTDCGTTPNIRLLAETNNERLATRRLVYTSS